jgi:hypothetical protein
VLRPEDVWRSRGAQDGVDEARGGPAWAGITEALGGGWHSFGSTLRRNCFDDAMGPAWAGRWRRRPWRSCSGAQGAVAWPGRWRHGKAECSVAILARRRAERKRRGTQPRRGSYVGIRTRHARGGGGCMAMCGAEVAGGQQRQHEVPGGDQATTSNISKPAQIL